jgi:hypothetical protein
MPTAIWGRLMRKFGMVFGIAIAAGACAGRAPQPVAVVQPQDRYADCAAITAEIEADNQKVKELASEQGLKVGQNVAAGVAGLSGLAPALCHGFSGLGQQGGCRPPESPAIPRDPGGAKMRSRCTYATGSASQALTPVISRGAPHEGAMMGGLISKPVSHATPRPGSCRFGVAFHQTKRTRPFLFHRRSCRQRSPSSEDSRISIGPYPQP